MFSPGSLFSPSPETLRVTILKTRTDRREVKLGFEYLLHLLWNRNSLGKHCGHQSLLTIWSLFEKDWSAGSPVCEGQCSYRSRSHCHRTRSFVKLSKSRYPISAIFFIGKMVKGTVVGPIGKSQSSRSPRAGLRSLQSLSILGKLALYAQLRKSTLGSRRQQFHHAITCC